MGKVSPIFIKLPPRTHGIGQVARSGGFMILKIIIVAALLIAGLLAFAATKPKTFHPPVASDLS
jgi:hypothetical protein